MSTNHLIPLPCGHKITEAKLLQISGRVQSARRRKPTGGKRDGAGRPGKGKLTEDQQADIAAALDGCGRGDQKIVAWNLAEQYGVSVRTILRARVTHRSRVARLQ